MGNGSIDSSLIRYSLQNLVTIKVHRKKYQKELKMNDRQSIQGIAINFTVTHNHLPPTTTKPTE